MLIAILVMLSIWGVSKLIKHFWLKNPGKIFSVILSVVIACLGVVVQIFVTTTLNESSGVSPDPMSYLSNGFITLCISIYIVYTTLRKGTVEEQHANDQFIGGFHGVSISNLKNMSFVELAEAYSLSKIDSVKKQLISDEIAQRKEGSQFKKMALVSLVSAVIGTFIPIFVQLTFSSSTIISESQESDGSIQCVELTAEEGKDFNRFSKYSPVPSSGYASEGYYYYLENKYSEYQACTGE
ncbi:MAG: hypothetical protein COA96_15060 [SAR86 cluster bacterium]|uniref:Uncharacterized protein n=1 Tax=SAR86 cluster bacterium TaxID=2030880 RepID=A0A2A5ARX5_9GAMM|nr:MAG: hypothetical protein COA96_15060 [SAR86 cluster bacterium]